MKTYAYVENGRVKEIIAPVSWPAPDPAIRDAVPMEVWDEWVKCAGAEVPLSRRYTKEFCAMCVDITHVDPEPKEGQLYDGSTFTSYPDGMGN